jgi:hypothetical protein|tara:strand:+ start:790 stop:1440 length:651 start_codon:yes stop_codon:yes gene_type:complete
MLTKKETIINLRNTILGHNPQPHLIKVYSDKAARSDSSSQVRVEIRESYIPVLIRRDRELVNGSWGSWGKWYDAETSNWKAEDLSTEVRVALLDLQIKEAHYRGDNAAIRTFERWQNEMMEEATISPSIEFTELQALRESNKWCWFYYPSIRDRYIDGDHHATVICRNPAHHASVMMAAGYDVEYFENDDRFFVNILSEPKFDLYEEYGESGYRIR